MSKGEGTDMPIAASKLYKYYLREFAMYVILACAQDLVDDIAPPIVVFFINESSALARGIPGPATDTRA